LRFDDAMLQEA